MFARALPFVLLAAGCANNALDGGGVVMAADGATVADLGAGAIAADLGTAADLATTSLVCGALDGRQCDVLAQGQTLPAALAVDGQNVYWRNLGQPNSPDPKAADLFVHGQLLSLPVAGAATPSLLAGELSHSIAVPSPLALLLVDGTLYFGLLNPGINWELAGCATSGCVTPSVLANSAVEGLAFDGSRIYWSTYSDASVLSAPLAGGSPQALWAPDPTMPGAGAPSGIAVDDANVYWSNSLGSILRCAKSGCGSAPTVVTTSTSFATALVLDADNLYWTNNDPADLGAIYQCPKSGCSAPIVLADQRNQAVALTVDSTDVYWAELGAETIARCAIGGCADQPTVLAAGLASPTALALDAEYVYWTEAGVAGDGTVKRMAK